MPNLTSTSTRNDANGPKIRQRFVSFPGNANWKLGFQTKKPQNLHCCESPWKQFAQAQKSVATLTRIQTKRKTDSTKGKWKPKRNLEIKTTNWESETVERLAATIIVTFQAAKSESESVGWRADSVSTRDQINAHQNPERT